MSKNLSKNVNFEDLEQILLHLNKRNPNWVLIQGLVEKNGLPFEKSVNRQIDLILSYLNTVKFKKEANIEM